MRQLFTNRRKAVAVSALLFFLSITILFLQLYPPITRREIRIFESTELENMITVFDTHKDGPCIFLIGGIHGDEEAGWQAARQLATSCPIKNGTLYILPVANPYGAQHSLRYMKDGEDLNRAFPGDTSGSKTAQYASAVFDIIIGTDPDLVLDLHEAVKSTGDGGSGYSVIYTDFQICSPYLLPLMEDSGNPRLNTTVPYGLTGPAVPKSLNRSISDFLGIPVLTIETCRDLPLEDRIQEQLSLVHYFFSLSGAT